LATRREHGNDDHHILAGDPDPEHAGPRWRAIHAKLDKMIRARAAANRFIGNEDLSEEELSALRRRQAREELAGNAEPSPS
jgi:hypothetical protein